VKKTIEIETAVAMNCRRERHSRMQDHAAVFSGGLIWNCGVVASTVAAQYLHPSETA